MLSFPLLSHLDAADNSFFAACGNKNPDSAMICALKTELYAGGLNCGRTIKLTRTDNGKSIEVEVADVRLRFCAGIRSTVLQQNMTSSRTDVSLVRTRGLRGPEHRRL